MRVLITGIAGFAGSHLAEYALGQRAEVIGAIRATTRTDRLERIKRSITLITCDLRDPASVHRLIDGARPDRVFHLAAVTPKTNVLPAVSALSTNVTCQINLLEAIRTRWPKASVHVAGSWDEYGLVFEDECPITEGNPIRPLSAYAVSKVAQDFLGYHYFMTYGLRIVRTRAFGHLGTRQRDSTPLASLARQVVEIERGFRPPVLTIRDLGSRREFVDVRDVVRAYWLAVQQAPPGEVYNVAAGHAYSTRQLVDTLLGVASLSIEVRVQRGHRTLPFQTPLLLGDSHRLTDVTGWVPLIGLEQTCTDLVNYWRERLPQRAA